MLMLESLFSNVNTKIKDLAHTGTAAEPARDRDILWDSPLTSGVVCRRPAAAGAGAAPPPPAARAQRVALSPPSPVSRLWIPRSGRRPRTRCSLTRVSQWHSGWLSRLRLSSLYTPLTCFLCGKCVPISQPRSSHRHRRSDSPAGPTPWPNPGPTPWAVVDATAALSVEVLVLHPLYHVILQHLMPGWVLRMLQERMRMLQERIRDTQARP